MKNIEPYLIFDGNCAEAFAFYESVFGVKTAFISRYRDLPDEEKENVKETDMDKILHVLLPVSKQVSLMGADLSGDGQRIVGSDVYLTLNVESETEAHLLFEKLSEGGTVEFPIQKTFWAERYAMFADKFGIRWMINYILPE